MLRATVWVIVVCAIICMIAGSAFADRLILTPTGKTLSTGGIKAEALLKADGDGQAYWINAGISRFEVEGARFQDFGADDVDSISAQISILPETSFTPAISIGGRDLSDETKDKGALYNGRAFYVAATKSVPVTGGIPIILQDVKVHGGIGTNSLSGLFFGAEGRLFGGINLSAEYDTEDFNFAAAYGIIPTLRAEVASIKGDFFFGAKFSTSF